MNSHVTTPEDGVRRYYDANTAKFERFGQARSHGAIHRAVWGPGVTSRAAAFAYIEELILRELEGIEPGRQAPPHLLDLGCGVGASLIFAARRKPLRGTGITLSKVQAELATRRIHQAGLADRVQCVQASFLAIPASIPAVDLAFSIEAFVHTPDPRGYFAAAAEKVSPGGLLIVVDDFLTERATLPLAKREQRWLDEFRRGWHVHTLITRAQADRLAAEAGFSARAGTDLTAYLELRRPRDLLISAAVAISRHLPIPSQYWRMQLGGNALQMAVMSRLIEFHFAVYARNTGPADAQSAAAPRAPIGRTHCTRPPMALTR
jgi:cyclopropane fatty-acyl-phospholipid synthase-like methyltransferase